MNPRGATALSSHSPDRSTRLVSLLFGLLVVSVSALLIRTWLIRHTPIIARDGIIYVAMAQDLESALDGGDSLAETVQRYDYHPGYSFVMALVHRTVASDSDPTEARETWELVGQCTSLVAGVLATVGVWVLGGCLFGFRSAWVGALLFGISRKWSALGADVLSDALAVCLGIWALVLTIVVLRMLSRRTVLPIILAGVCGLLSGAGYLVRPEIGMVAIIAAMTWTVGLIGRFNRWRQTLGTIVAVGAGAAACALPYALVIGGLTGKKPTSLIAPGAAAVVVTIAVAMLVRAKRRRLALGLVLAVITAGVAVIFITSAGGADWAWLPLALAELFSELPDAAPVVMVASLAGLVTLVVRWIHPPAVPGPDVPSARPEGALPIVCLQLFLWGMLLALYRTSGYISHRHLILSAASLAPLAGVGATAAAGILVLTSRRLGRPIPMRAMLGVVVTVVAALLFSHARRPLHEKQGPSRQAAEQLALLVSAGDVVLVNSPYIAYYGNVPTRHLPNEDRLSEASLLQLLAADANVRYLVVSRAHSTELGPSPANGRLRQQRVCRLRDDRNSSADVIIYAVTPAGLPGESP